MMIILRSILLIYYIIIAIFGFWTSDANRSSRRSWETTLTEASLGKMGSLA